MSGLSGFHHVAIHVPDFDATVRFYREVLGMTEAHRWGEPGKEAVMLDTGDGSYVEIFHGGEPADGVQSILHMALRTDDVDGVIDRVRAAGAEVTIEPRDVDIPCETVFPVRIAFCKGPAGEVIEFFQER